MLKLKTGKKYKTKNGRFVIVYESHTSRYCYWGTVTNPQDIKIKYNIVGEAIALYDFTTNWLLQDKDKRDYDLVHISYESTLDIMGEI